MKKKLSHMNYCALLMKKRGVKKKAAEAVLANIKAESSYNPKAIQAGLAGGTGIGLFQWSCYANISGSQIHKILNSSNKDSIKLQMNKFFNEPQQWIMHGNYPMTWSQFLTNKYGLSRRKLTIAFMQQWERPANHSVAAGNGRWLRWLPDYRKLKW